MASGPVLIAGSGVAGPAVAIAFARAGIEAVVYEAASSPRDDAGAFFNLAPNGLAALRALGVGHVLDDMGFRNDRLVFHNDRGRALADVPVGGITLMRGALSSALRHEASQLGIPVVFGKRIESAQEGAAHVRVRCSDGLVTEWRSVIGADGIHSGTRAAAFPDAPAPTYTGIINLGGVVQTDLPSTGEATHMIFGRRAFFGYAVRPSGETYWFSNYAQPEEPARGEYSQLSADALRDRLLTLHRGDPPEVQRILNRVTGAVGAFPIYDMPALPSWHRGAVCLIGDAAHAIGPHVGQGASLALEDAGVVAKCLRDAPSPGEAFALFESLRRPRVEPVVTQSRRTAQQKVPKGWLGRAVRDLVLPIFLRHGAKVAQQLYEFDLHWSDPVGAASAQ